MSDRELVARAFCAASGRNPDEEIIHDWGGPNVQIFPRWKDFVPHADAVLAALSAAGRLRAEDDPPTEGASKCSTP